MDAIKSVYPLDFVWETEDPFLFCVHHLDYYPQGNAEQGPKDSLKGRQIGQDFDSSNAWRMYHGHQIPGFPEHPHRGFETVTITLDGIVDHFDSLGASGRYGYGDVQWMTAGEGCQHCEMFPLIHMDKPNTLHLFQIWLNLPSRSKFVPASYKMIWHEELVKVNPSAGTEVTVIAGTFDGADAIEPTPDSWANDPANKVGIFLVEMASGSELLLKDTSTSLNRNLYYYKGSTLSIDGVNIESSQRIRLGHTDIKIINTGDPASLLVLQGEPINEPVAKYGPFVMNTSAEIQQAYQDYQRTRFGGWPWDRSDQVFNREDGRIAKYKDGTCSYPPNMTPLT